MKSWPQLGPSYGIVIGVCLATVTAGGGVAWAALQGTSERQGTSDTPVVVARSSETLAPVSRQLTGSNIDQWFDDAHGLWDSEANAPDPDVVEKTSRAGVGIVRFPGGTPANLYDWQQGIGPVEERGCQADGRPNGGEGAQDSRYGPDEFMRFAEAVGAEPDIMTPMANQTPAQAADWVEYMNAPVGTNPRGGTAWADVRKANGRPEPYRVARWEIGNEPDRGGQNYWRSTDPDTSLRQYSFGGQQQQEGQRLADGCDRRASASVSDGAAGQSYQLFFPPAAPESQTVYVDGAAWSEVADLDQAGGNDTVYEFDPQRGEVRFGDGTHGAVPAAGAKLTADYLVAPKPGFVDFYAAMKQADPSIDVCSTWSPITEDTSASVTFPELMAAAGRADQYDCVVVHPYTNFFRDYQDRDWETPREGHDEHILGERRAVGLVADLKADLAEHSTADAYPAISEFGALWFNQMGDISSYPSWQTSMSHATYMASQWAHYAQLGVPWTMGNTLISDQENPLRAVLGASPHFVYTADATVREQLKPVLDAGGSSVRTTVRDNPEVTPYEPEPAFGTYDALVGSASIGKDGRMRIIVVNRDPEQAVTAQVAPAGFRHASEVAVSLVAGDDYTSFNGVENPDDITIERSVVETGSRAFHHRFPAASVTVLELSPAS